jgi:hypothetical protein
MDTRRDFLQKLTLGVGATALSDLPASARALYSGPKADKQLRVALMGLGSYATRVADAMKDCKMATLVGAVSGTPAKLGNLETEIQHPREEYL